MSEQAAARLGSQPSVGLTPLSLFPTTLPASLHSGPPASWLQPTLAVPLQDLSGIELGLAGQSLRLEWAAGAGSCVLLPRDARHCRAFLEELSGETRVGGGRERQGWQGPRGCGSHVWLLQWRQTGNGTHPSQKFLKSRHMENGKVLRGGEVGTEQMEFLRVPCPWLALSRCLALFAPDLEEQHQHHAGGGDPEAPALVSR